MPWSSTSVAFPLAVPHHMLCDTEIKTEVPSAFYSDSRKMIKASVAETCVSKVSASYSSLYVTVPVSL